MYPNQPYTPDSGLPDATSGQPLPVGAMPIPPLPAGGMSAASPTEQGAAANPNIAWLPPTVPVQPASGAGFQNGQNTPSAGTAVPDVADDGDLIEKEWVSGVKAIIMRTRQDPYLQTKELHKLKADYMKKRYNKIIEPVEE